MKRNLCLGLLLLALAGIAMLGWKPSGGASSVAAAAPKNIFTPDAVQFGSAPSFIPAGAQLAVLEGNPLGSSGDYTVRLKMPDGYRFPPHHHPKRENVTVISGTFKVGMGDHFVESAMASFPPGSFAYLDPNMHHFAEASGEVVVQIHGEAPLAVIYINPQDDPSRK